MITSNMISSLNFRKCHQDNVGDDNDGGHFITARKRSLGQGNIFVGVCQEFCSRRGGEYLGRCPPWANTPLGRHAPWQVHPPWD